jgi:hypothetical protein
VRGCVEKVRSDEYLPTSVAAHFTCPSPVRAWVVVDIDCRRYSYGIVQTHMDPLELMNQQVAPSSFPVFKSNRYRPSRTHRSNPFESHRRDVLLHEHRRQLVDAGASVLLGTAASTLAIWYRVFDVAAVRGQCIRIAIRRDRPGNGQLAEEREDVSWDSWCSADRPRAPR